VVEHASPFASFQEEADSPRPARRRRRRSAGGAWWIGPAVSLLVLALAGVATFVFWDRILTLLPPPANPVVTEATNPAVGTEDSSSAEKGSGQEAVRTEQAPPTSSDPAGVPPPPRKPDRPPSSTQAPTRAASNFPRRALIVSVHNYLYANPVHYLRAGGGKPSSFFSLVNGLSNGLRVPFRQIAHLSDAADKDPRPPTRSVIEKTLTDFLKTSRPQDRILVFFIGHAVEVGDEAYLVPIEGETDNAATLIPLKWVYQQLAACPARQKALVLDVNHFNPTMGVERPGGGPMGARLDAALKEPPPGVQVWSSCVQKQQSYETENFPMGVFLGELSGALMAGLSNKIQRPEEPLPLEQYVEVVNRRMKGELEPLKFVQESRLTGREAEGGAPYDKNEPPPPPPSLGTVVVHKDDVRRIRKVLDEIGTPPVKVSANDFSVHYEVLPPFSPAALKKYDDAGGDPNSKLRAAVRKARVLLWAIYPGKPPQDLAAAVTKARQGLTVNLHVLQEGYRAPAAAAENQFKQRVLRDEENVARLMLYLNEMLDELRAAGEDRDKETRHWQANYDFMLARLEAQIAYLYEYQSMLGGIRKEFPPRDPGVHGGWKLAAQMNLQGDATGKKLAKGSRKTLDQLIKDHAGTPWEVLAKREKLTALGLEWHPTR
jgi:hypothetical protein